MKWREIFLFELGIQLRRPIVWLLMLGVATYSLLWLSSKTSGLASDIPLTAPLNTTAYVIFSSQFWMFLLAVMLGSAAGRDYQLQAESLYRTSPLSNWQYVGGRLVAAVSIAYIWMIIALYAGLLVADLFAGLPFPMVTLPVMYSVGKALLVFGLPNLIVTGLLLYALILISRKPMLAFGFAFFLLVYDIVSMQWLGMHYGFWNLSKLVDHSGLAVLQFQKNTISENLLASVPISLSSIFWLNRVAWLSAGSALLLGVLKLGQSSIGSRKSQLNNSTAATLTAEEWNLEPMPSVFPSFGQISQFRQLLHTVRWVFSGALFSPLGLGIIGMALFIGTILPELMEGDLGVPTLATTDRLLTYIHSPMVFAIGVLFIVMLSGKLVWQARNENMHELQATLPLSNTIQYWGNLLGILAFIAVFQLSIAVVGIGFQLIDGFYAINWSAYLTTIFGLQFRNFAMMAMVALSCHVLIRQQYMGYVVAMLIFFLSQHPDKFSLEDSLLIFSSGSELPFLNAAGKYQKLFPWFLYSLYWLGWCLLFAAFSIQWWPRGNRKFSFNTKFRLDQPILTSLASVLIIGCGSFLYYQTHSVQPYLTKDDRDERRVTYEKLYGQFQDKPQPYLTSVKLNVALYPEEEYAEVQGKYWLKNNLAQAIDTLHLAIASEVEMELVKVNREAKVLIQDNDLGHHTYVLAETLKPGDSLSIDFSLNYTGKALAYIPSKSKVNDASVLIQSKEWLPAVGYQPERELSDSLERANHGLAYRPVVPLVTDTLARYRLSGREMIQFEATISTSAEHTLIGPGQLQKRWQKDGRNFARYQSEVPIRNGYALFSAPYELQKKDWKGIELQVYHSPNHSNLAPTFLAAMKASLEYYNEQFGKYPHSQLSMVESAGLQGMATSYPTTIAYSPEFARMQPELDTRGFNLAYAVTAHEVAHQWWANRLVPAYAEGAPLLTESLAWYSALNVVEKAKGKAHLDSLISIMRESYERAGQEKQKKSKDVSFNSLVKATDWLSAYRTGPLKMYDMRQELGEVQMNKALKELLEKFEKAKPPLATSLDLVEALKE